LRERFSGGDQASVALGRMSAPDPKVLEALMEGAERIARAESEGDDASSGEVSREDLETALAELRKDFEQQLEEATASDGDDGEDEPQTGQNQMTVTNANDAIAYQPLRGNFDLVYLPDFEEQYVVDSKSGWGNAKFALQLGQGWSLQGLDALSDNSELNKRIFGLIDTAIEAGEGALAGATGGGTIAAGGLGALARAESLGDSMELAAGTPVALKVVVLRYAAKGLYPVLKPRELQAASKSAVTLPVDGASTGGGATESAYRRIAGHTVPVYPYQHISFNTFDYMSLELLTVDGLPFGDLYDKTGTQGDPGDRQAVDLGDAIRTNAGAKKKEQAPDRQAATDQVREALNEQVGAMAAGDPLKQLAPSNMEWEGDALKVTLDGERREVDEDAFGTRLVELLTAAGVGEPSSGWQFKFDFGGDDGGQD
ncbi:MAG: hypothetical protein AAFZ65_13770, partial [Planctomycetota bacterium]